MAKRKRLWVIKAGSQMVISGGPILVRAWMTQIAQLQKLHGIDVIWVTSGAIAHAVERTKFPKRRKRLPEKQALSAIGQPMVMDLYNLSLNALGRTGAQVLLTAGDMRDPVRRKNLQNTLEQLLIWKTLPILNENDTVATDEIQFGDNDSLSSRIAHVMKAERLVLLTDVDGFYDRDPRRFKNAQRVSYLPRVSKSHLKVAGQGSSVSVGTGGMYSKLMAAQFASQKGIVTHLLRGDLPQGLLRLAQGEPLGTQIGGRQK